MRSVIFALIWSWLMASSFVVSALITPYASPVATTGLRFILAFVIMTPFYLSGSHGASSLKTVFRSPKLLMQYFVISGSLVGFFVGLFTALKTTTSLNSAVIYTWVPILGALFALGFGIQTRMRQWFGYILGSGGAIVVLLFTRQGDFVWHVGDVIYFGACGLLAFHVISVQLWGTQVSTFEGAYRMMLFGSLWLVPITLIWGELGEVQWQSQTFWSLLAYLTVFTTLLTFVLQQQVVSHAGASRLLGFSYTIPIWVSCYQAVKYTGLTVLSGGFVIGAVMVLLALFMIDSMNQYNRVPANGPTTS